MITLLTEFHKQLGREFKLVEESNSILIVTPFKYINGMQILLRFSIVDNHCLLTDTGDLVNHFRLLLQSPMAKRVLNEMEEEFGTFFDDEELFLVWDTEDTFGHHVYQFLHNIIAVDTFISLQAIKTLTPATT
jgi:hypothetical protein